MILLDRTLAKHYLDTETGERYASVSQVVDVLFPGRFQFVAPDVLEAARVRGRRLHLLFGLLLLWHEGVAEEPAVEAQDRAVADGLVNWILAHDVRPLKVEEAAVNSKECYGGTPDCKVLYGPRRQVVIPDLKSGVADLAHSIQVQAYARLSGYEDAARLVDVYVDQDGDVREVWVEFSAHDYVWFLNGLGVLKGRLSRGL